MIKTEYIIFIFHNIKNIMCINNYFVGKFKECNLTIIEKFVNFYIQQINVILLLNFVKEYISTINFI